MALCVYSSVAYGMWSNIFCDSLWHPPAAFYSVINPLGKGVFWSTAIPVSTSCASLHSGGDVILLHPNQNVISLVPNLPVTQLISTVHRHSCHALWSCPTGIPECLQLVPWYLSPVVHVAIRFLWWQGDYRDCCTEVMKLVFLPRLRTLWLCYYYMSTIVGPTTTLLGRVSPLWCKFYCVGRLYFCFPYCSILGGYDLVIMAVHFWLHCCIIITWLFWNIFACILATVAAANSWL